MKYRIIAALLALCLLFSMALAENAAEAPNYISAEDCGLPLRALQDRLGVTEIDPESKEPYCGDVTLAALEQFQREHGLEVSCEFDAATLYALLELTAMDEAEDPLVWVPMHGGERYHAEPLCSNMIEPQQMPMSCASALEYTPCRRCCKE